MPSFIAPSATPPWRTLSYAAIAPPSSAGVAARRWSESMILESGDGVRVA